MVITLAIQTARVYHSYAFPFFRMYTSRVSGIPYSRFPFFHLMHHFRRIQCERESETRENPRERAAPRPELCIHDLRNRGLHNRSYTNRPRAFDAEPGVKLLCLRQT